MSSTTTTTTSTSSSSSSSSTSSPSTSSSPLFAPGKLSCGAGFAAVKSPSGPWQTEHNDEIPLWSTDDAKTQSVFQKTWRLNVQMHDVTIPLKKENTNKLDKHGKEIKPINIPDWTWCVMPDFVNVMCVTREGDWLLFHQAKYAVGRVFGTNTIAPVGGYVDAKDNDPLDAAKRELLEELGYLSDDWVLLSSSVADANRGCGVGYLYCAFNAYPAPAASQVASDDLEEQHVLSWKTEQLEEELLNGSFKVHSWCAAAAMALLMWKKRQQTQTQAK